MVGFSPVSGDGRSANGAFAVSKGDLQSQNQELTAANHLLRETLDRQRTTSNDLLNVLCSTNVATLFLDPALKIRFFTPATKALFTITPEDIGRSLSDLQTLTLTDGDLPGDSAAALTALEPIEREIETESGLCFLRRVSPYHTPDNRVEGVVITFSDITERRRIADELGVAKRDADQANAAKTRFLAAASHDLRQPLQTLSLLQGLLAKHVETDTARNLVTRFEETLGAMSGMLNTLLDINQIEAGTVHAEPMTFTVNGLLAQLLNEFRYHAQAKGLVLRVVPCALSIESDPRLLEQMIRNLVSNALKYTRRGKVLLGCRRHGASVTIEVWDTGIGIPDSELDAIFEEYHQIDNPARQRNRGLGLGLSIVRRLGNLLGHEVQVQSRPGKGSVFSIKVPYVANAVEPPSVGLTLGTRDPVRDTVHHTGTILVIEDDPDVRELLAEFLRDDGHDVIAVADGVAALALVTANMGRPDIILADYNLPNGMNGVQTTTRIRETLFRPIPAIILTGDITIGTLSDIALRDCIRLSKPVKMQDLMQAIQHLLPLALATGPARATRAAETPGRAGPPVVFVVDDDAGIRGAIRAVLEDDDRVVEDFASCEEFLDAVRGGREGCLVIDAYLPGMNGLALLTQLQKTGHRLPAIMITGNSDVAIAVPAMKAGAIDFVEKPITRIDLLASVDRAMEQSHGASKLTAWREDAAGHVADLTPRQRQIMDLVLAGHPSKNIAADLGISQRTVENHRASIMTKTGSKSLPALARLALAAAENEKAEGLK